MIFTNALEEKPKNCNLDSIRIDYYVYWNMGQKLNEWGNLMKQKKNLNRRSFIASTAAGTAAGIAAFHIVPNTVFGAPNHPAPSDKLLFGNIGVGGRGMAFVRPDNSIAICDVDENHLKQAAERAAPNAKLFKDYRELLDQKDIDAVFIAAPDHWHAVMMVNACEAGKDVYVEKPACNTIEEGRAMVDAANRYARVVQVGSQGRSQTGAYYACQYIRNGQIGQVKEVRCWHYGNPAGSWNPDSEPPKELDYDRWVGPNRWIPYNSEQLHFNFRWLRDFGGGQIRDRGAHIMSISNWIMNCDTSGPVLIESKGEPQFKGRYDLPQTMEIVYHFKNPDWKLVWAIPGEPHIEGVNIKPEEVKGSFGAYYVGEKGTLTVSYGDGEHTDTEQKAKDYKPPKDAPVIARNDGRHRENFEECILTRKKPIMSIEAGHSVASLCVLGNVSLYLGRNLEWDPVAEKVINDDEANRLLSKPGRGEFYL